ncbi:hypothetical protein KI387_019849, partial [Taxus chinensis]
TAGTIVRVGRESAGLLKDSPFWAARRYLSQAVRDSWDESTRGTRKTRKGEKSANRNKEARIGRSRRFSSGTDGTK